MSSKPRGTAAGGARRGSSATPALAAPSGAALVRGALAAALPVLALYAATLHPGLPAGDSGELITVAAKGGVAHPPGYPLYTMVAGAFVHLLPLGSVAWRANLLSALCMAAAAGVLAVAVARASRSLAAGVLAAWLFALTPVAWRYALVAEVFALHALLAAGVLCALTLAPRRAVVVLAAAGGLALTHHHTLLLLLAPAWIAVFVAALRGEPAANRGGAAMRLLGSSALATLAGLLPLLWIPFATRHADALVWGDARTLNGFLSLLLRAEYGTFQLDAAGRGASGVAGRHLQELLGSLPAALGALGCVAAAVGVFALLRRQRTLLIALAGYASLQLWFFTRIGFESGVPVLQGVVERFHLLPVLVLAFAAGLGMGALLSRARRPARWVLVGMAGLGLVLVARVRLPEVSERGNTFVDSYGRSLLAALPERAVLFTRGDLEHNALAYLQRVEHVRPDVTVIDQELLSYPWYVRQWRARVPGLLPDFSRAQRIELADGRVLEGWSVPRPDSTVDVLSQDDLSALPLATTAAALRDPHGEFADPAAASAFAVKLAQQGVVALPAASVRRVSAAASESLYASTRAGFRRAAFLERGDDRYGGFPGSRNLGWADHLVNVRPVLVTGTKDDSYVLRYETFPMGRAKWLRPRGASAPLDTLLAAALAAVASADPAARLRDYPLTSFEWSLRSSLHQDVARAALLLCQPLGPELRARTRRDAEPVYAAARELERLPLPAAPARGATVDAYTLRAIGFLRALDPAFRDTTLARTDLQRALAANAYAAQDRDAQAILRLLAEGRVPEPAR